MEEGPPSCTLPKLNQMIQSSPLFLLIFLTCPKAFYAKPQTNPDGSMNLMVWDCGIPGKPGVRMIRYVQYSYSFVCRPFGTVQYFHSQWNFQKIIQANPQNVRLSPLVIEVGRFAANFFHPNVYPSGTVCLSIVNEDEDWKPSITVNQVQLF